MQAIEAVGVWAPPEVGAVFSGAVAARGRRPVLAEPDELVARLMAGELRQLVWLGAAEREAEVAERVRTSNGAAERVVRWPIGGERPAALAWLDDPAAKPLDWDSGAASLATPELLAALGWLGVDLCVRLETSDGTFGLCMSRGKVVSAAREGWRIEDLPELRQDEVLGRAFGLRAGPDGGTESAASGLVRDLEFVCDYAAQFERVAPYQAHVTRIIERLVGARALRFATAEHAPSEHGLDLLSLVRHGLAALPDEPRRARIGTAPLRVDGVPAWLREALPVRRFGRLLFDLREGVDPGEAVTHSGIDAADAESALALTILTGVATTVAAPPEAPSPPPVAPAPRRYFDELHAMADEAARSGARRRLAGTRFEPAGERIGDILLFYRVGSGGSGTVFLGLQLGIGGFAKTVAVKRLLDTRVGDPAARNAFLAEARIVACLQHPNIATTFGLTLHDDQEFMVMEFIHGVPLDLFLSRAAARGATIPDALVRYIGSEVARGLDYLHSRVDPDGRPLNFVHRDIAPPNVLLGFDGSVKLIDFSIAHSDAHELQAIDPRARAGRRCYMAPEVARGHAIDFRADQFGLAATLFELATGRRRVEPTTPGASAASGEPHGGSVLARAPNVSPRLAYIIERGLAPEREDRFPSADAFRDALLKDGLDGDPINLQREILASHFGALCAREQDAIRRMRRGAAEVLPLHVAGSAGAISPGQPLDLVEGGPEPGR